MNVGQRIKARRQQLGMNAETLAAKIGVSASTIYRYENGGIDKVDASKLISIADALYTTPVYLMGRNEENVQPPEPPESMDLDEWIPLAPGFKDMPADFQRDMKTAVANIWKTYHDLSKNRKEDD